ncbi:unnamed protein product [Prorocentrum cordatum]|uniref:EF-hand domain-containing protein n=1 Tax=Prorocentrum cordatum TaxID=2364126 RepID=A0ABN9QI70_9DINO|nr:unnamed protein product [Polarella glacialis]
MMGSMAVWSSGVARGQCGRRPPAAAGCGWMAGALAEDSEGGTSPAEGVALPRLGLAPPKAGSAPSGRGTAGQGGAAPGAGGVRLPQLDSPRLPGSELAQAPQARPPELCGRGGQAAEPCATPGGLELPGSAKASGSRARPAALELAGADPLPARPGADVGRPAAKLAAVQFRGEFAACLHEEFAACLDEGEVDRLLRIAQRVTSSSPSDTFSTSGAQAYRLREALRPLRESPEGAAMGYSHRLWVNRAIVKQAQRRRRQLASGRPPRGEEKHPQVQRGVDPQRVQCHGIRKVWAPCGFPSRGGGRGGRRGGAHGAMASGRWGSSSEAEASRSAALQGRQSRRLLLRRGSGDLGPRRGSQESDLVGDFVLEGEEFFGDEAKKQALHNVFGIGLLKGVDAFRVWRKVFEALKVDGEVHHTDLRRALEMAGFQNLDKDCIEAAKQQATKWSTLSVAQFNEFAIHFGTECERLEGNVFKQFDTDSSGQINRGELEGLLKHFGVVPMRHVLDEVLEEVDKDGSGNIGLDEFREVFAILRLREGFSRKEFQYLNDLFKRFDLDGSDKIDKREVSQLLGYLGYRLGADEQDNILQEVDAVGSGELGQFEFLLFMRKCRQREASKLTAAFKSSDSEADGASCFGQLLQVFHRMGYQPDPEAAWEAAEAVGISSREASLDTSDLWRVLTECRAREWFSIAELQQIGRAFEEADAWGRGELGVAQIDKALLGLGLSLRSELLLLLVGKVDLDCSGLLSQAEFRKLIRLHQLGQDQLAQATFQDFLDEDGFVLSAFDSWRAFSALGLVTRRKDSDVARVRAMGTLDWRAFQQQARALEKEQQMFRQRNCGFSEQAVSDLAMRFAQFDTNNGGTLEKGDLVALIESILPGVATAPESRPMLMRMLEEAQGRSGALTGSDMLERREANVGLTSGQMGLSFPQFLKFLSLVRVYKVDQLVQREEKVIEECGLSIYDVQQFRELFLENASGDDFMTVSDLWTLFGTICPLGDKNKAELQQHFMDVVGPTAKNCEVTITCAELMMLLGRLRDANFGGIRDRFSS